MFSISAGFGILAAAVISTVGNIIGADKQSQANSEAIDAQRAASKQAEQSLYQGMYGNKGAAPTIKSFEDMQEQFGGGGGPGSLMAYALTTQKLKEYEGKPIDEIPEEFRKYFNENAASRGALSYLDDAESQTLGYLDRGKTRQLGALESGRDAALGAYGEGRDASLGAYGEGRDASLGAYGEGRDASLGAYGEGRDASLGALESGRDAASKYYQPYSQAGEQALGAYQKALSEGYDPTKSKAFQLKEQLASKYLDQKLSAAGKARSGVGVAQYSLPAYAKMVQQSEQDYFNRLNPLMQYGYGANTALANTNTQYGRDVANVQTGYGRDVANVQTGYGRDVANVQTGYGQNVAGLQSRHGQNVAGLQSGYGQNVARVEGADTTSRANLAQSINTNRSQLATQYGRDLANAQQGLGASEAQAALRQGDIQAGTIKGVGDVINSGISQYAQLKGYQEDPYKRYYNYA